MKCEGCGWEGKDALVRVVGTGNIIHCPKCYEVMDVMDRSIQKQLADEVQAAFDTWTNSGHQKHTRAVFRHMEKVYARITGRAWR